MPWLKTDWSFGNSSTNIFDKLNTQSHNHSKFDVSKTFSITLLFLERPRIYSLLSYCPHEIFSSPLWCRRLTSQVNFPEILIICVLRISKKFISIFPRIIKAAFSSGRDEFQAGDILYEEFGMCFRSLSQVWPITGTPLLATLTSGLCAAVAALLIQLDVLVEMMSIGELYVRSFSYFPHTAQLFLHRSV